MEGQKVGILAECVCDLPEQMLREYDIDVVHFRITTDSGVFTDHAEITARNIFELMEAGGKVKSSAPSPDIYQAFFEEHLKRYDQLMLVAISSKISNSCANAGQAVRSMGEDGKRVHIFDSGHLSTGLGHMVYRAGAMARAGATVEEITAELEGMRSRVSTSFIARSADYLYRSGKVSKQVKELCFLMSIHPVLAIKNGALTLKGVEFGDYEKSCRRYLRKALKGAGRIDTRRAFFTHARCSSRLIGMAREEVNRHCPFEELLETEASATVSSNCGPDSMGILFVYTDDGGGAEK